MPSSREKNNLKQRNEAANLRAQKRTEKNPLARLLNGDSLLGAMPSLLEEVLVLKGTPREELPKLSRTVQKNIFTQFLMAHGTALDKEVLTLAIAALKHAHLQGMQQQAYAQQLLANETLFSSYAKKVFADAKTRADQSHLTDEKNTLLAFPNLTLNKDVVRNYRNFLGAKLANDEDVTQDDIDTLKALVTDDGVKKAIQEAYDESVTATELAGINLPGEDFRSPIAAGQPYTLSDAQEAVRRLNFYCEQEEAMLTAAEEKAEQDLRAAVQSWQLADGGVVVAPPLGNYAPHLPALAAGVAVVPLTQDEQNTIDNLLARASYNNRGTPDLKELEIEGEINQLQSELDALAQQRADLTQLEVDRWTKIAQLSRIPFEPLLSMLKDVSSQGSFANMHELFSAITNLHRTDLVEICWNKVLANANFEQSDNGELRLTAQGQAVGARLEDSPAVAGNVAQDLQAFLTVDQNGNGAAEDEIRQQMFLQLARKQRQQNQVCAYQAPADLVNHDIQTLDNSIHEKERERYIKQQQKNAVTAVKDDLNADQDFINANTNKATVGTRRQELDGVKAEVKKLKQVIKQQPQKAKNLAAIDLDNTLKKPLMALLHLAHETKGLDAGKLDVIRDSSVYKSVGKTNQLTNQQCFELMKVLPQANLAEAVYLVVYSENVQKAMLKGDKKALSKIFGNLLVDSRINTLSGTQYTIASRIELLKSFLTTFVQPVVNLQQACGQHLQQQMLDGITPDAKTDDERWQAFNDVSKENGNVPVATHVKAQCDHAGLDADTVKRAVDVQLLLQRIGVDNVAANPALPGNEFALNTEAGAKAFLDHWRGKIDNYQAYMNLLGAKLAPTVENLQQLSLQGVELSADQLIAARRAEGIFADAARALNGNGNGDAQALQNCKVESQALATVDRYTNQKWLEKKLYASPVSGQSTIIINEQRNPNDKGVKKYDYSVQGDVQKNDLPTHFIAGKKLLGANAPNNFTQIEGAKEMVINIPDASAAYRLLSGVEDGNNNKLQVKSLRITVDSKGNMSCEAFPAQDAEGDELLDKSEVLQRKVGSLFVESIAWQGNDSGKTTIESAVSAEFSAERNQVITAMLTELKAAANHATTNDQPYMASRAVMQRQIAVKP